METSASPTDAAVLAVLAQERDFVGDAELRVARHFGIKPSEAHALLSRLFNAGHVRLLRRDGVMTYEPARGDKT
jgi:DNA-binding transcriptional ArsR family regulator